MTYEERILLHEAAKRATNLSEMATIQARVSTQIDAAMKRPPLQCQNSKSNQNDIRQQIAIVGDTLAGAFVGIVGEEQIRARRQVRLARIAEVGGKRRLEFFALDLVQPDLLRLQGSRHLH